MKIINQLNDTQVKEYAKFCADNRTSKELRIATNETPEQEMLDEWGLTEGEYAEAVAAALAEIES